MNPAVRDFLAFLSPIISSVIILYIQWSHTNIEKKRDQQLKDEREIIAIKDNLLQAAVIERANSRKSESILTMRMIDAIGKLSNATARALKEGRVNGVMETALMCYIRTAEDMTNFLQKQAVEHYEGN